MTLTASGALSLNEINIEKGGTTGTQCDLTGLESGINQFSASRPDGATPNSVNEWYSYNHLATTTTAGLKTVNWSYTNSGGTTHNFRIFVNTVEVVFVTDTDSGSFEMAVGSDIYAVAYLKANDCHQPGQAYGWVQEGGGTYSSYFSDCPTCTSTSRNIKLIEEISYDAGTDWV